MDERTIMNILEFLKRVDLKGFESPAMTDAMQKLEALMLAQRRALTGNHLDLDAQKEG